MKRSNDGSEPDIHRIQVHLMRPLIHRPVSVREIVVRIEHSGTLLLADVWNQDFFFSSTCTLCLWKALGWGLEGEEIQFSDHRNELVDKRRIWMAKEDGVWRWETVLTRAGSKRLCLLWPFILSGQRSTFHGLAEPYRPNTSQQFGPPASSLAPYCFSYRHERSANMYIDKTDHKNKAHYEADSFRTSCSVFISFYIAIKTGLLSCCIT